LFASYKNYNIIISKNTKKKVEEVEEVEVIGAEPGFLGYAGLTIKIVHLAGSPCSVLRIW
jgi:hypothetical protein